MSEEKPLLEEFFDWLVGLFAPKSSAEDSGETPDEPSQPEPEVDERELDTEVEKRHIDNPPPTGKEDPRLRGLAT